jgi:integrase
VFCSFVVQILNNNTRANAFLDSIGRNSKNTRKMYGTGLKHFADFLLQNKNQTMDTIILPLQKQRINVYELLDLFISYLSNLPNVSTHSLKSYMAAVRSYLEYSDIDISNSKFKRKVKIPRFYPDSEQPLDIADIRELLNHCNNARLRCYLLVLLSSGLRAMEASALRSCDVDFTCHPTKIHVRREYSKTRRPRDVYISEEATNHLTKLLEFRKNQLKPESLIFSTRLNAKQPKTIYDKMVFQFQQLQRIAHKDTRKENSRRRKITLHSFRRTAYSIINDQVGSEYANWYLGHNHSPYWTHKETERRKIYLEKCMPHLTILDYTALDTRSKNIETALKEKDKAIQQLTKQMRDMEEHYKDIELHQKEMSDVLQNLTPETLKRIRDS